MMIGRSGSPSSECDEHFLADSRDMDDPPLLAGPGAGDTNPARAVGVVRSEAVPGELDFHPAVFISKDFLARGADHDRGLCPLNDRTRGGSGRLERQRERDAFKGIRVRGLAIGARSVSLAHGGLMVNRGQYVLAVAVEVPIQGEFAPRRELAAGARTADVHAGRGLLLHANRGGSSVVVEDVLNVGGPISSPGGDAVEPLGIGARELVQLELVVVRDLELVADSADLDGVKGRLNCLEVFAR